MKIKNLRVTIYSLLAIILLFLTFKVDWLFIIPAVYIMFRNQKELIGTKK